MRTQNHKQNVVISRIIRFPIFFRLKMCKRVGEKGLVPYSVLRRVPKSQDLDMVRAQNFNRSVNYTHKIFSSKICDNLCIVKMISGSKVDFIKS